ncbi:hypothetical protein KUL72_31050 [Bradyrhizobium arachidis]|uniref:hypothetical protein n=1 Tax=Bradyrhizobium arachidis TaxID=858423 RepID=UPI002163EF58|nr:hypothetical protein [Bradyrhizobium arachidis]UVO35758.1 hypothetical protein KUL72_31050 [Bradyrhizobium arachidis]
MFHALSIKLGLVLGGVYQPARKPKPLMVGFPACLETADAFLGAKGRSPPVVADEPKFPAAYRAAFY